MVKRFNSGQGLLFGEGSMTVDDARELILDGRDGKDGVRCPCCRRLCKVYSRRLHPSMAKGLVRLVRRWEVKQDWVHFRELGQDGFGDFPKLVFWGLMEPKPSDDKASKSKTKKYSGYWRPTKAGLEVAKGKRTFPKYVLMYHGEPLGYRGDALNIRDAFQSEGFHYDELWQ